MNSIGDTLLRMEVRKDIKEFRTGGMSMEQFDKYGIDFNNVKDYSELVEILKRKKFGGGGTGERSISFNGGISGSNGEKNWSIGASWKKTF